jgi:hypothetical protein
VLQVHWEEEADVQIVSDAVEKIEALDFQHCDLSVASHLVQLDKLLSKSVDHLSILRFTNCFLSDQTLTKCVKKLETNEKLQEIYFENCAELTMTSLLSLCALFLPPKRIQVLHLSSCKLTRQGKRSVVQ